MKQNGRRHYCWTSNKLASDIKKKKQQQLTKVCILSSAIVRLLLCMEQTCKWKPNLGGLFRLNPTPSGNMRKRTTSQRSFIYFRYSAPSGFLIRARMLCPFLNPMRRHVNDFHWSVEKIILSPVVYHWQYSIVATGVGRIFIFLACLFGIARWESSQLTLTMEL